MRGRAAGWRRLNVRDGRHLRQDGRGISPAASGTNGWGGVGAPVTFGCSSALVRGERAVVRTCCPQLSAPVATTCQTAPSPNSPPRPDQPRHPPVAPARPRGTLRGAGASRRDRRTRPAARRRDSGGRRRRRRRQTPVGTRAVIARGCVQEWRGGEVAPERVVVVAQWRSACEGGGGSGRGRCERGGSGGGGGGRAPAD